MSNEKLRVGVIGVGAWGKNHARVYHEIPDVELVGVCDMKESNAKTIANKFKVKAFTDPKEFLETQNLDIVDVCTPTTTHFEIAQIALENNTNVLVEKPVTSTVEEAKELRSLAKKKGLTLTVGFIERFNQVTLEARELIEQGDIGQVLTLAGHRIGPFWPERLWDVGVVKDSAIHEIDVFRYILQKDPQRVFAVGGKFRHKYEDHVKIILDFGNGLNGSIEANFLTPYKERAIRITGEKAVFYGNYQTQEIHYETEKWKNTYKIPWKEPLSAELQAFVHSVKEKTEPRATADDGVRVLQICEAVLESMRIGEPVKLSY